MIPSAKPLPYEDSLE